MHPSRYLLSAALALTLTACGGDDDEPQFSERTLRDLDTTLETLFAEYDIPGVNAGLWVPGVGSWTRSLGVADIETGAPMRFDQHVRIGSVTKTFTVTLILQLHDEGLLDIDDPVDEYFDTNPGSDKITLDNAIPNGDRITLRNLANMTSGLASYTFNPDFLDRLFGETDRFWEPLEMANIGIADSVAGCPHEPSQCFEPGTDWAYNNTNTVLLGLVAEQVSGQSLQKLTEARILQVLGMDNTIFPTDATLLEPYAHGYTNQGGYPEFTDATFWNPTWGWGTGNLVSTLPDLRIWARALGRGELLEPATQALRETQVNVGPNVPGERAYALGMGYVDGWWGHGGELPGYNTVVFYRPDVDAVLLVSANYDHRTVDTPDGPREISPAHAIGDAIIAIASREAPLGDLDGDLPFIDVVLP